MGLILGMQCIQGDSFVRDPARLARLAELVTDTRWLYRFKLLSTVWQWGNPPAPRFPGVIPAAKLRETTFEALSSSSVASALLGISTKDSLDHAHFQINLARDLPDPAASSNARVRLPDGVDRDKAATAWVELQHAIVETLGAIHGVIVTGTNEYVVNAEIWLSLTTVDGKVMHPRPEEINSYAARKWLLGHAHVRRPRWGTYLKPAHVEAVGGRERIVEVVQPEVTREVGDLFYVQLTARVSEATSDLAKQRYRAFAELLAPITMPPAP